MCSAKSIGRVAALAVCLLLAWSAPLSMAWAEDASSSATPSATAGDGSSGESSPSSSSSLPPSPAPSSGSEPSPSPTVAVVFVEVAPGSELEGWVRGTGIAVTLCVFLAAVAVAGSWGRR